MTDAPPKPSHAGPLLATAVLLPLWLALTCAAPWLAPQIAKIAVNVEIALGLDVLPGRKDDDTADRPRGGAP